MLKVIGQALKKAFGRMLLVVIITALEETLIVLKDVRDGKDNQEPAKVDIKE